MRAAAANAETSRARVPTFFYPLFFHSFFLNAVCSRAEFWREHCRRLFVVGMLHARRAISAVLKACSMRADEYKYVISN